MKLLNSPKIDILLHKIVDSLENQEARLILFFLRLKDIFYHS